MSFYTFAKVDAAMKAHNTIFFNGDLEPVEPVVGDWFCEFQLVTPDEGEPEVRDEQLVEYCGASESGGWGGMPVRTAHRVIAEGDDCDRDTDALFLVRQNY